MKYVMIKDFGKRSKIAAIYKKFNYDDIPIMTMQNTAGDWLKEYKDVITAKINAQNIIQQLTKYLLTSTVATMEYFVYEISFGTIFRFYSDLPDFLDNIIDTAASNLDNIKQETIIKSQPKALTIAIRYNELYILYDFIRNGSLNTLFILTSIDELKELLFNVFYYKYSINNNIKINSLIG